MAKAQKSSFGLTRERSFVRPNSNQYQIQQDPYLFQLQFLNDKKNKNSQIQVNAKGKPTLEIYRPPNVRSIGSSGNNSGTPKLNVHAKEFTTKYNQLQSSRSSGALLMGVDYGNLHQQSFSGGNTLQEVSNAHKIHFNKTSGTNKTTNSTKFNPKTHEGKPKPAHATRQVRFQENTLPLGLQRSKSLGAADMKTRRIYNADNTIDLWNFPPPIQATVFKAMDDPNQLPARELMELVRHIMERVLESRKIAEPAAKLCIQIIEKEKKETFLESLLNTCRQWCLERNKTLKSAPTKFPAFMAFLNEMYCQLKRMQLQLKTHHDGVPPNLLLLTLLSKCCQDCLGSPSVTSLNEMECLFFVLTSIGRDLEQELPKQLEAILNGVRDAFLTAQTAPNIRKTLLQLIELSAARWQLPAPAVMYYYPGSSK